MSPPARPATRRWFPPATIALATWAAVVCSIDPAGSYPRMFEGPGLTVDESFHVQQGVRLAIGIPAWLRGELTWEEVFGGPEELGGNAPLGYHLADHPPVGRLLIGIAHRATYAIAPPLEPATPFVTACGRTGAATAFALTVFLVGILTARWYGMAAGMVAAISLVLMPRVYGHAHLASLETFIGLMYAATVFAVADLWPSRGETAPHTVSMRAAAFCGALLGLALLTKIQGVFLPVVISVWALFHLRLRAVKPLALFGAVALAVFFVGWPWLWFDPVDHCLEYLGRTTGRLPLNVWYFGRRWADTQVPWHYPWVMFLVTIPLGLQLLGAWGVASDGRRGRQEPREQLLLGAILFPLLVFSGPGVAVYDGARLFLVTYPVWAVFIGRGGAAALQWLGRRVSAGRAVSLLGLLLVLQSSGVVLFRPCYLSYYNALVGGTWGAARLGFEPTYWGESITRDLLQEVVDRVPEDTTIELAPVLHQFQVEELQNQSPILRRHKIRLVPFDHDAGIHYVLLYRRLADLPESLKTRTDKPLAEVKRQGVPLAVLHDAP